LKYYVVDGFNKKLQTDLIYTDFSKPLCSFIQSRSARVSENSLTWILCY